MLLGFVFEVDDIGYIKWPIKDDLYCWSRALNTNLLYYILYFTLCSTNHNLSYVYLFIFFILNFDSIIKKIKQTHNKL